MNSSIVRVTLVLIVVGLCALFALDCDRSTGESPTPGDTSREMRAERTERSSPAHVAADEVHAAESAAAVGDTTVVCVIGAPTDSVRVDVRRSGATTDVPAERVADADARDEFVVPRGPAQVFVRAPGFVAEHVQLTGAEERVEVVLREGRACWIRVLDPAGNALANASLQVFSSSPDGYEAREVRSTDRDGLVRLDLDPRGDAITSHVRASAPGVAPSDLLALPHWDQTQWTREAPHVISLSTGVAVRLHCRAADSDEPVTGAVLRASDGQQIRLEDAAADGTLSFRLPPAKADASYGWSGVIRAPGYGDTAVDLEIAPGARSVEREVELAATWSRSFQVEADGGIPAGTRAIFRFGLEDAASGGRLGTQLAQRILSVPAHGRVELRDAPTGVVPTRTDLIVVSPDFRVTRLRVGGPSRNVWPVHLGDPPEVHPDVRIVRADGAPLVGGRVSYRWLPEGDQFAVAVSERRIRGDQARIPVPVSRGQGRWLVTVWDGESLPVSIDTTGELPDEVRLQRAVSIHGNVRDGDGSPARGAHVLVRWDADFRATMTGPDGHFRVRVPDRVPTADVTVRHAGQRWDRSLSLPSGPLRIEWE